MYTCCKNSIFTAFYGRELSEIILTFEEGNGEQREEEKVFKYLKPFLSCHLVSELKKVLFIADVSAK
jgi:hypothetical protein